MNLSIMYVPKYACENNLCINVLDSNPSLFLVDVINVNSNSALNK